MVKKFLLALLLPLVVNTTFALTEQQCLAEVVWREARGEPFLGKVAVAQVALNRTLDPKYPATICGVMFQPGQFPWVKTDYKRPKADSDSHIIAAMVMDGTLEVKNLTATYFARKDVWFGWNNVRKARTIGHHTFYNEKVAPTNPILPEFHFWAHSGVGSRVPQTAWESQVYTP